MMLTTFAIHPAASKQLIARATAALPEVQWALEHGRIFIGHRNNKYSCSGGTFKHTNNQSRFTCSRCDYTAVCLSSPIPISAQPPGALKKGS